MYDSQRHHRPTSGQRVTPPGGTLVRAIDAGPAVHKFGGSCLRSPEAFARMGEILKTKPRPTIAVVSALHGVTSALERACTRALHQGRVDLSEVSAPHLRAVAWLSFPRRAQALETLQTLLQTLETHLLAIACRGRMTPRDRDRVLAFGEQASVRLGAHLLAEAGVTARALVADEAGLLSDDGHGDARLLDAAMPATRQRLAAPTIHLVAGFVGRAATGHLTTMGRGGSDYTATFLGGALGLPTILYKDTPGVCAAPPHLVPEARVIGHLSWAEAKLLGQLGARVVFDKAMDEAERMGTRILVRSFSHGDGPGSLISEPRPSDSADALTCMGDIVLIPGHGTNGSPPPLAQLERLQPCPTTGDSGPVTAVARSTAGTGGPATPAQRPLTLVSLISSSQEPPCPAALVAAVETVSAPPVAVGQCRRRGVVSLAVEPHQLRDVVRALHRNLLDPQHHGSRNAATAS